MQRLAYLLFPLGLVLITIWGCSKKKKDDGPMTAGSYVKFGVQGTHVNGNYQIEKKSFSGDVVAICTYVPRDVQAAEDAKVTLSMMEAGQSVGFALVVPATEKLTEIIRDNPHAFQIAFLFGSGALEASTVSVHVTDLKLDESDSLPLVTRIKGNFEGVVLRIYDENGERKEEPHTVKGEFEYNLPK